MANRIRNIALTEASLIDVRDNSNCSTPLIDYVKLILKELNVSYKDENSSCPEENCTGICAPDIEITYDEDTHELCVSVGDEQECIELNISSTVVTENCDGIELSGTGIEGDPLTACVVIDDNPCNIISVSEDGLLALQTFSASYEDGIVTFDFGCEQEEELDLSGLYEFDNGLTKTGNLVQFGGDLVQDTTLNLDGFDLIVEGDDIYLTDYPGDTRDDSEEYTPTSFLYTDDNGKLLEAPIELLQTDLTAIAQNDLGWNSDTSMIEQGYPLTRDTSTDLGEYERTWANNDGESILTLFPNDNIDFGYSGTTTLPFEHYRMTSSVESIPAAWLDSGAVTVTRYNKVDYNNGAAGTSNLRMRWFDQGVSGNSSFSFISGSQSNATTFTRNSTMRVWGGIGTGTTPLAGIYVEGYNAATGGASDNWTPFSGINVGGIIQTMNDTARQFYGYNLTTDFNQPDIGAFTNPTINITGLNIVPTLTENGTVNLIGVNFAPNISANPTVASDYKFLSSTRGKAVFGNADFLGYIRPHRATTTQITNVKNTLGTAGTGELLGGEIIFDTTSEELKFYKISIDDFVAV